MEGWKAKLRYQEGQIHSPTARLPQPEMCSSPRGPFLPRLKGREIVKSNRLFLSLELPPSLLSSSVSLHHFPTASSFRSPKVVRASHDLRLTEVASPRNYEDKKRLRPKIVHMGMRPVAVNLLLDRPEVA